METRDKVRYIIIFLWIIALGGVSTFAYLLLYQKPNIMSKAAVEEKIAKPCIGKIELIDSNQRIIYFVVNGERYSFGSVGRLEVYYYATIGDSIIKKANSRMVKVVKPDNSFREFEIEEK